MVLIHVICNTNVHYLNPIFSVIYIIVDINSPPILTTHSNSQVYSPVSSSQDGDIPLNGAAANSIRIQAVFGPSHFNIQNDYFEFNVGDGAVTINNNLTVINSPLDPSITYHISYYILFNDENGVSQIYYNIFIR